MRCIIANCLSHWLHLEMQAHPGTPAQNQPLNDPRVIRGWTFFDWANSSYALIISSAIFPAYYASVTDDVVRIAGRTISNTAVYANALSLAYILIALLSPILSGVADASGRKKFFLKFFTTLGATSCISLFFFEGMEQFGLGIGGFVLATIGFAGALVFYNSYLPQIATEDRFDRVSAQGFAMGYTGSVLLLLFNLAVIMNHQTLGITEGMATRWAFVSVGLWWFGFALIPFRRLPKDRAGRFEPHTLRKGFIELSNVWRQLPKLKELRRFLLAFFFYSAGVQTVLYMAATFAEKELQFETVNLILLILTLQLVAIGGAFLFALLSERFGNKSSLMTMLVIWMGVCITGYYTHTQAMFYVIAACVGLVMGGIQSLSRSTYSKLVPANSPDKTSFFSFYDILEKLAIVAGTFSWGAIEILTGGMRPAILALIVFFLIGMQTLYRVKLEHGFRQAEGQSNHS